MSSQFVSLERLGDGRLLTVIGVVSDVRMNALVLIAPSICYSTASRRWPSMDVVVRTAGDPKAVIASVRNRIHTLDSTLPLSNLHPMSSRFAAPGAQPRLDAGLLTAFSALPLVIVALGIYGVLAHSVALILIAVTELA